PFEGPVVVERLTDGQTLNISYKAAHNVFIAPKDKER
ncbi:metal-dependent transcriptional regulator, partial [Limosilactobacillus fermentum]|nr:metal-dependent transcriptional regulator [Limosilactobacillus fermentum]